MDANNTSASNYIPVTSELQTVHYVQVDADHCVTAPTSDDRVVENQLSDLLRATGTGDSEAHYDGDSRIVTISTAASSPPVLPSPAPAYTTSTIHGTIPSQSAISILQLPPDNPLIQNQEEGKNDTPLTDATFSQLKPVSCFMYSSLLYCIRNIGHVFLSIRNLRHP